MMKKWVNIDGSPKDSDTSTISFNDIVRMVWRVYGGGIYMDKSKETWKIDGFLWLHCPVCGTEVMDYDICDVCRWQNTGIINIDGGPNKMTLAKAKEAYVKGIPII